MNNINENNKILNISFNQDNSCFSVSTEKGFKIYETIPFKKEYEKNMGGGIRLTEMYYRSNILAFVSGGDFPKYDQKKLITVFIVNKAAPKVEIFNFCGLVLRKIIIIKFF